MRDVEKGVKMTLMDGFESFAKSIITWYEEKGRDPDVVG